MFRRRSGRILFALLQLHSCLRGWPNVVRQWRSRDVRDELHYRMLGVRNAGALRHTADLHGRGWLGEVHLQYRRGVHELEGGLLGVDGGQLRGGF
jgi:hypothetical protein